MISRGGSAQKCLRDRLSAGVVAGGGAVSGAPERLAVLTRYARSGSKGFSYTSIQRGRGTVAAAKPETIVITKLTYHGIAALHVERGVLSIRLCLRQLRCKVANGEVKVPHTMVDVAADAPLRVAEVSGFPGHSPIEWPSGATIGVVQYDRASSPQDYDASHPLGASGSKMDADVYRKICANGPESFVKYGLRSQWRALRGQSACARIVAVAREFADKVRAKRASGLSSDAYIETNHRGKNFEGSVLTSKRFAIGIANGGVAQTPKGLTKLSENLNVNG